MENEITAHKAGTGPISPSPRWPFRGPRGYTLAVIESE